MEKPMKIMNVIVVYDQSREHILMCRRVKDPYTGKLNFVGGKVKPGETFLEAAYRELYEETAISPDDIKLVHLMDMVYHTYRVEIQVFAGRLNKPASVHGEENPLLWMDANGDYTDMNKYAGEGNIAHIMEMIRDDIDNILS